MPEICSIYKYRTLKITLRGCRTATKVEFVVDLSLFVQAMLNLGDMKVSVAKYTTDKNGKHRPSVKNILIFCIKTSKKKSESN